jgi:multicomponent Na+:H+ antiporter subunit D
VSDAALILLALATPLAGAALIWLSGRRPLQRELVSLGVAMALCGFVAALTPRVLAGGRPAVSLIEVLPGLDLAFEVEPLGMLFGLTASFLWIVTTIYTIGYLRANKERHQTRFYACFALALASSIGVAFAANMFTLFLFYEALTLSTYPLVTHSGSPAARRAGRIYLGILLTTSIGLQLLAILWTWVEVGTLDFRAGGILDGRVSEATMAVLLVLYVFGVGKAALVPFHRWLPAAMVAPVPVSALLHAVAVVKAGVFTVAKILIYIFGLDTLRGLVGSDWLVYVAGATILIASVIALRQDNLKLRLAYSTVSQLSYVVIGVALANSYAVLGGTMHIAIHAFGKITLFFCAGSKWYLVLGSLSSGHYVVLAILLASSVLNALYFLPIVARAFFPFGGAKAAPSAGGKITEAPLLCVVALGISALGTVVLFFYPQFLFELLQPLTTR